MDAPKERWRLVATSDGHPIDLSAASTRGMMWLSSMSGIVFVASAIAQIILGWLLSESDFGVYAIAIAFSLAFDVFREGGISRFLARTTPSGFRAQYGDAFWLAMLLSVVAALLLVAATPFAAGIYDESALYLMLPVIAISLPLNAYRVVALPKLQIDLRFRALAKIEGSSALIRYASVVAFASVGFGALSFVLPLVVVGIYEMVAAYVATRLRPWTRSFHFARSKAFFGHTNWALAGTALHKFQARIVYLTLGIVVSSAAVGVYFFAFQLTFQLVYLFSGGLQKVLLPAFARIGADRERQSGALVRSARLLSLVASPVFAILMLLSGPGLELVWQGKWNAASVPLGAFAASVPFYLYAFLVENLAQARGRFRLWASVLMIQVVALGGSALFLGLHFGSNAIGQVAALMAIVMIVNSLVEIAFLCGRLDITLSRFLRAVALPYVYAFACAGGLLAMPWEAWDTGIVSRMVISFTGFSVAMILGGATFFRRDAAAAAQLARRALGKL